MKETEIAWKINKCWTKWIKLISNDEVLIQLILYAVNSGILTIENWIKWF